MQAVPGSDDHGGGDEDVGFGEINITPLTDVFLVLLIILMVVSTSVVEDEKSRAYEEGRLAEQALQIMTPSSGGDSEIEIEDVILSVEANRTIYLNEELIPIDALDDRLVLLRSEQPNSRIVLRGDQTASYEVVMDIIARCTRVGLRNIALATQENTAAPEAP